MRGWFEERRGEHAVAHLHQDRKYLYRVLVFVGTGIKPTSVHYVVGRRDWARWEADTRIDIWDKKLRRRSGLGRMSKTYLTDERTH